MAIDWRQESAHLVVSRLSGEMSYEDFIELNRSVEPPTDGRKVHAMILLDGFEGWKASDSWGDLEFVDRNDKLLDRIAIVGERRWQEQMEMFMLKDLRPVDIRYFYPDEEDDARSWLQGN